MSKSANASRVIALLVLLMAAMVLLSGPVAEVLDLPSPTAEAKKKHKHKKKKKKKPFPFNVVQCPTKDPFFCFDTPANDFLIGRPPEGPTGAFDIIRGREGTDVYNGGNGSDTWEDFSETSSDVYLFPSTEFSEEDDPVFQKDHGSNSDTFGLSSYSVLDFDVTRVGDQLRLDGPGNREIVIVDFFAEGKIETFLFREGSFTGDQIAGSATNATAEEEAALKEQLQERLAPSGEAAQPEDASS